VLFVVGVVAVIIIVIIYLLRNDNHDSNNKRTSTWAGQKRPVNVDTQQLPTGSILRIFWTGQHSPPVPTPPLTFPPSHPLPFYPLHSPPLPLEVGPLNPARGLGKRCKLPQRDLGRSPSRIWILVHFSLKIWHLVATVLMIFLKINWPNAILDSTFWLDSTLKIDPGCPYHNKPLHTLHNNISLYYLKNARGLRLYQIAWNWLVMNKVSYRKQIASQPSLSTV